MRYKLAPYMHLGYDGQFFKIGYGSIQEKIESEKLSKSLIRFMGFLKNYKTMEEMEGYLIVDEEMEKVDAINTMDLFLKKKYLALEGELSDLQQYSGRDLLFYGLYTHTPSHVLDRLRNSKVAVIGCGGIGSNIAVTLANKGIGRIVLVDHDVIETSNLNRNFIFKLEDIGKNKVDVLGSYIKANSPFDPEVEVISQKLDTYDKLNVLSYADLIVLSCDDYKFIRFVTPFLYRQKLPHIISGYLEDIIIWGPLFVPPDTSCYHCFAKNNIDTLGDFGKDLEDIIIDINNSYMAPAIAELTMISSSFAALDIVKFLGKFGEVYSLGKRVGLWSHNMQMQTQECVHHQTCDVCGVDIK
jgi:molybdopterin/thiamine biosynthesis adenylyltransferase